MSNPFSSFRKKNILMARLFCLYLILIILLINEIKMNMSSDENTLFLRHIGAARENRYRAQQQQHQQRISNRIQIPQQSFLSPELLRARWNELYKVQNKNNAQ